MSVTLATTVPDLPVQMSTSVPLIHVTQMHNVQMYQAVTLVHATTVTSVTESTVSTLMNVPLTHVTIMLLVQMYKVVTLVLVIAAILETD